MSFLPYFVAKEANTESVLLTETLHSLQITLIQLHVMKLKDAVS